MRTSSFLKSRRVVYLGIFIMLNELPLAARLYRYQLISIFLPKADVMTGTSLEGGNLFC